MGCGYDDILDGNTDNYVIFSHFIKLIQPYWTHNSYLEEQREKMGGLTKPPLLLLILPQNMNFEEYFCTIDNHAVNIPLYCPVDPRIFHPWLFEVDTVNIAELRSGPPAGWKCPEKVIHQYSV